MGKIPPRTPGSVGHSAIGTVEVIQNFRSTVSQWISTWNWRCSTLSRSVSCYPALRLWPFSMGDPCCPQRHASRLRNFSGRLTSLRLGSVWGASKTLWHIGRCCFHAHHRSTQSTVYINNAHLVNSATNVIRGAKHHCRAHKSEMMWQLESVGHGHH